MKWDLESLGRLNDGQARLDFLFFSRQRVDLNEPEESEVLAQNTLAVEVEAIDKGGILFFNAFPSSHMQPFHFVKRN